MAHAVCKLPGCGWTCSAESSAGPVGPLVVVAAITYGMCRLSEWAGTFRLAVVGFSVAALVVGIVANALVASIRSGRHGARISAVLDQIAVEDETAPVVYDGPDEDEVDPVRVEVSGEVEDEETAESDPVLAPVVELRRVA